MATLPTTFSTWFLPFHFSSRRRLCLQRLLWTPCQFCFQPAWQQSLEFKHSKLGTIMAACFYLHSSFTFLHWFSWLFRVFFWHFDPKPGLGQDVSWPWRWFQHLDVLLHLSFNVELRQNLVFNSSLQSYVLILLWVYFFFLLADSLRLGLLGWPWPWPQRPCVSEWLSHLSESSLGWSLEREKEKSSVKPRIPIAY